MWGTLKSSGIIHCLQEEGRPWKPSTLLTRGRQTLETFNFEVLVINSCLRANKRLLFCVTVAIPSSWAVIKGFCLLAALLLTLRLVLKLDLLLC